MSWLDKDKMPEGLNDKEVIYVFDDDPSVLIKLQLNRRSDNQNWEFKILDQWDIKYRHYHSYMDIYEHNGNVKRIGYTSDNRFKYCEIGMPITVDMTRHKEEPCR